jgi:hypothetical protein
MLMIIIMIKANLINLCILYNVIIMIDQFVDELFD